MAFLNSIYKALTGKDVEALLQKLSERETEVQELKAKIASQATTITSQSTRIKNLNKNLKESSENLESIKEQLDAEQTSNKTLSLRMTRFQTRISELKKDLEEEQTSKSAIEERFNDTQVELSKANNQIEELTEKNNSHANEIRRLTDLIEKASAEKNSFKEKLETIQKSLSEAEQKTVQQTNLLQQEKEKYANAEQLLSKAESDSRELNSELSATKAQIFELSTKLQQTQNEKDEVLAENLSLNKQLQELSEKIALQESIINEKINSDNVDVAEVDVYETTDEETEEGNDEVEVEENVEEVPQEDETTEFEIDWDNVELEITDVEQDTILTDSTLSITKVWDVRNKKEIDAKQFFSLPEGEIMSMRRELQLAITTDNPYWVCPVCGQMVKISGKRTARGKALFFSHLHDSEDCPIKTNTGLTKRMIEARKYALVQESERHHRLKTSIANFLEETNSKNKGISDVQIEKRVTTDLPFMNWRCPDVQAMYNGMHLVFELQLSTTFISTIVERDLFYRLNNYFIIWVFNFEENKEYMDLTNLMCKDIYYANKRNIFVFDRDAQTESFKRKELVLKCNWLNADNTWQYGPNNGDRNGIFITLDQLKFDTKNNKPYYYDAEEEYFLKHQDKVVLREKQELDLQTVLEGLERREQQKKERKELREAKKAEEKVYIETVVDVVAEEKVVLPDAVKAEPEEKKALGKINANGHEYVDLGLPSGTLWATCNVGATKPEEYGDYFAWGEVRPKSEYSWEHYKWCDGDLHSINKYCNDSKYGEVDNKTILELCDDAVNVNWGGTWRIPTKEELDELKEFTTWTWINQNGIKGYKVTSKINGNSIFLPAAGFRYNSDLRNAGSLGYYWSSSLLTDYSYYAYRLYFYSGDVYSDYYYRYYGQSVRLVLRVEFTLSFVPNDGQGEMPAVVKPFKQAFTLPTCTFSRDGYEFIAWNTQPDGTGEKYEAGDTISLSANTTLYAQWKERLKKENMHNGHEYVDLGLPSGTLWATCNVGATKPEENGDYFAWGEVKPKSNYCWWTYEWRTNQKKFYNWKDRTWSKEKGKYLTKYCKNSWQGYVDRNTQLKLSDDVANVKWGGKWCLPTKDEQDELRNNSYTTWIWITSNGIMGYKITSKINGNSIFLPTTGCRVDYDLNSAETDGNYWGCSLNINDSLYASELHFNLDNVSSCYGNRTSGRTVRPVVRAKKIYNLMFEGNGGVGVMKRIKVKHFDKVEIPNNEFLNHGYEFIGWNTKADGTGDSYKSDDTINLYSNTTLYAQWIEVNCNMHNGHGFVDLGLPSGTLWATYNIGATKPEERGDYFAWGEVKPKSEYSWENYKWCDGRYDKLTKYCRQSGYGTIEGREKLEIEDDAAHVNWGGDWRLPSRVEQDELKDMNYTTWTWICLNRIYGYLITSKINGNCVFFPAAGVDYGSEYGGWGYGYYRSNNGDGLVFNSDNVKCGEHCRCSGLSIRPVMSK
ncbi:MAG: DUF6035 family protein [Paludibacteraceae bacterium]|nr:DUF6035 family protein [Paludibacteraceae bacterium]